MSASRYDGTNLANLVPLVSLLESIEQEYRPAYRSATVEEENATRGTAAQARQVKSAGNVKIDEGTKKSQKSTNLKDCRMQGSSPNVR